MAALNSYSFADFSDSGNPPGPSNEENPYEMSLKEDGCEPTYNNIEFERIPQAGVEENSASSHPVTEQATLKEKFPRLNWTAVILSIFVVVSLVIGASCMALLFQEKAKIQSALSEQSKEQNQLISMSQSSLEEKLNEQSRTQDEQKKELNEQKQRISQNQKNFEKALNEQEQEQKQLISMTKEDFERVLLNESDVRINETRKLAADIETLNSSMMLNEEKFDRIVAALTNSVRLRGTGATISQGRVEIFYNGAWGTICDDLWDLHDAGVICRMLSFTRATSAPHSARFGQGSGQIWLDDVQCSGSEVWIYDCPKSSWGQHNCGHGEDASVVCV